MLPSPFGPRDEAWLRVGAAAPWLTTAVSVAHPSYRVVGEAYLSRLGLPAWPMWATCAAELLLGLAVLAGPARSRILAALQLGPVVTFTIVLAALEPMLLAHPFGVLSKNLPLCLLVVARLLAARGAGPIALSVLRAAMAVVWITEGLVPKILFQQSMELLVVERSGLVPFDASLFLYVLGAAQVASGVAALVLRGRVLGWLLSAQVVALVVLPVLVSLDDLELWVHPFGPLTKNVPLVCGTLVVRRLCSGSS